MSFFRCFSAFSFVSAVLLLTGCARLMEPAPVCALSALAKQRQLTAAPAPTPGGVSQLKEMPLNSLSIIDSGVIDKVLVRSISARRTPAGTTEVWSQILNCTASPLQIELRTQFYDNSQAPSEPVSGWRRVYLDPRTGNSYREFSSGNKTAHFYMVELREGR